MATCVIIGGGLVGLNVAFALAESRRVEHVWLLEREDFLGHHTSTRNSEVVHAGIAYPPASLMARLCVEGNRLTADIARRFDIPFRACGKWILAMDADEAEGLARLAENAIASGAVPLKEYTPNDAMRAVPEIARPQMACFAPSTALIDTASYVQKLSAALARLPNVQVVHPCRVLGADPISKQLSTDRGPIDYDLVINSAGLWADEMYHMLGGTRDLRIVPVKGEYYAWPQGTIQQVVYPVPRRFVPSAAGSHDSSMASLGVHFHRSLGGELLIGPNSVPGDASSKEDYAICTSAEDFVALVSRFLRTPPTAAELMPAYVGNRPRLLEKGKRVGDFVITREGDAIHLLGIESPGLTAAPAIAAHVAAMA